MLQRAKVENEFTIVRLEPEEWRLEEFYDGDKNHMIIHCHNDRKYRPRDAAETLLLKPSKDLIKGFSMDNAISPEDQLPKH